MKDLSAGYLKTLITDSGNEIKPDDNGVLDFSNVNGIKSARV